MHVHVSKFARSTVSCMVDMQFYSNFEINNFCSSNELPKYDNVIPFPAGKTYFRFVDDKLVEVSHNVFVCIVVALRPWQTAMVMSVTVFLQL